MVDTTDLKSVALKGVWVRLPPSAPALNPVIERPARRRRGTPRANLFTKKVYFLCIFFLRFSEGQLNYT